MIIKSTNGNVFGGFTKLNWSGDYEYKTDPNAFLFSFINQHNTKIVMKCTDPTNAIFGNRLYGPLFGESDLQICNNSNTSNESFSNLGDCYKHPYYVYNSNEAKSFLAGSYKFLTTEIEVYSNS